MSTAPTLSALTPRYEHLTDLSLARPDDWHLHLRDGAALQAVVAATAKQFARAIIMPNLKPPVTSTAQALAYRDRILTALVFSLQGNDRGSDQGSDQRAKQAQPSLAASFQPLMTLYLTDATPASEIRLAKASGRVHGVKLYPSGATTNSDAGVTSMDKVAPALEAMQELDMPLLVHGEVVDTEVDTFDREAVFIDRVMIPLRARFPALRIVFEHITTRQAAEYVTEVCLQELEQDRPAGTGAPRMKLGATITPQHMLYNRNAIFSGGLRPHWYCLPILKREEHRVALIKAATSGLPAFFLGTDSAPHAAHLKEHAAACAGCYTAPHAIELYAAAFESAGALDKLEAFASFYGADFYGLPRSTEHITLKRQTWQIPDSIAFGELEIVPLASGETLSWKLASD